MEPNVAGNREGDRQNQCSPSISRVRRVRAVQALPLTADWLPCGTTGKHQRLKHAAACRSTLKIGLGFFWKKILEQNINPVP